LLIYIIDEKIVLVNIGTHDEVYFLGKFGESASAGELFTRTTQNSCNKGNSI